MKQKYIRHFIFLVFFLFSVQFLKAEQFSFEGHEEVFVDLPEGIELVQAEEDASGYLLKSTLIPVSWTVKFYKDGRYKNAKNALEESLSKLGCSDIAAEDVLWRNTNAALGQFRIESKENAPINGWAVAAELHEEKGIVVFISWVQEYDSSPYDPFMLSSLDSLGIDRGSFFESGIVSQYAYPESSREITEKIEIDGKKIEAVLKDNDEEAAAFLVEREYQVLQLYAKSANWKKAWQRYYRMIFRDSFKRLKKTSFNIYNSLAEYCLDETDLAQKILTWTQSFKYEREKTSSDFTCLPSVIIGKGCDCDSRSMLLSVLLQNMGIDSIIFVSAEYSHAIAGLVSSHPGQAIECGEKKYLTGETTAKNCTWGMISQDQGDFSKWIPVEPPLPLSNEESK